MRRRYLSTNENPEFGTDEQHQALQDLVDLGFGRSIVNVCDVLQIDGGWLEKLVLDKMRVGGPL